MKIPATRFMVGLAVLCCDSGAVCGADEPVRPPPPLAAAAIAGVQTNLDSIARMLQGPALEVHRQRMAPVTRHLERFRLDWEGTLSQTPDSLGPQLRPLQEAFQFYFAGRTNFEELTIRTLLNPALAFEVSEADLGENDRRQLREAGIRLRVAWFALLARLGTKSVLPEDSRMASVNIARQFLEELSKEDLAAALSPDQFSLVIDAAHELMATLSDGFLERLADSHVRLYPSEQLLPYPTNLLNRAKQYRGSAAQLKAAIRRFYSATWKNNPVVFEARLVALANWTMDQLDLLYRTLTAAALFDTLNPDLARSFCDDVRKLGYRVKQASLQRRNGPSDLPTPHLTQKDRDLVREFCLYFHPWGGDFKVDCDPSAFLDDLKVDRKAETSHATKNCNPAINLDAPLEILVNYCQRHPGVELATRLAAIQAKLEEVREAAARLEGRAASKPGGSN